VLLPNRRLHVALGYNLPQGFYPPLARIISRAEFEAIVRLVQRHRLLAEPTSPLAESPRPQQQPPPAVLYHVDMSAGGLINRYHTTPQESPPTGELLAMLVLASGGELPPAKPRPDEKPLEVQR